jgi:hypothetical protein
MVSRTALVDAAGSLDAMGSKRKAAGSGRRAIIQNQPERTVMQVKNQLQKLT